jgi:hypothetical protein
VTATHQADSLRLVRVDEASIPSRWPPPIWFGKHIFFIKPGYKTLNSYENKTQEAFLQSSGYLCFEKAAGQFDKII